MLGIHFWGFAIGDTQEQPRLYFYLLGTDHCRKSSARVCAEECYPAPVGCETTLRVPPAQRQGGAKRGGHLSLQLTKFRRKRQLQVLKMPIRPPNKLSSVAGSSTTNYQYMGSCVGVDRDFKQPFEADILFQVEFVYLLFPQ